MELKVREDLKNEIIKLASKHKIEITQQISYGFDIKNYKKIPGRFGGGFVEILCYSLVAVTFFCYQDNKR